MSEIYNITPVRDKNELIHPELIRPGTDARFFPDGIGTRVVYLDPRYVYPKQVKFFDPEAEKARQVSIWEQIRQEANWFECMDKQIEQLEPARLRAIGQAVLSEVGNNTSAMYHERVFSEFFGEQLEVVALATGVTRFSQDVYHDIGFLR